MKITPLPPQVFDSAGQRGMYTYACLMWKQEDQSGLKIVMGKPLYEHNEGASDLWSWIKVRNLADANIEQILRRNGRRYPK